MKRLLSLVDFFGAPAIANGSLLLLAGPLLGFICWVHPLGAFVAAALVIGILGLSLFYMLILGPALNAAYDMGSGSGAGGMSIGATLPHVLGFAVAIAAVGFHWLPAVAPFLYVGVCIVVVSQAVLLANTLFWVSGSIARRYRRGADRKRDQ